VGDRLDVGHQTAVEQSETNLAAYCLHHHKLKTDADWKVQAHPDGRLTWTTPTGHRHITTPHDYGPEPGLDSAPPGAAGWPDPPEPVARRAPDPDPDPPPF